MGAKEAEPFFELLRCYYAGGFVRNGRGDWARLAAFSQEPLALSCPAVAHAAARIASPSGADADEFAYEFNRLFVGPDRLAAAPYETVYVSDSRTLMQGETRAVRKAYRAAGFEPQALNTQPDDHLAFELAFVAKLLERGTEEDMAAYTAFMNDHLGIWYRDHADEVRGATGNGLCVAFADLLEATVDNGRIR